MPQIRHLAICVFRHQNRILVAPGFDDVHNERFFRPLGGGIEFGELAADALRREIHEELGLAIKDPVRLGVLENRFQFRGKPGHEIVFVFDATFVDEAVYARDNIPILEGGWDGPAEWLNIEATIPRPLYPTGLEDLLR